MNQGVPAVRLLLRPSNDISVHISTLSMLRAVWRDGSPSVVRAVKALLNVVLPPPSPDPSVDDLRLYPTDVVSAAAEVILTLLDLSTVAPRDHDKGELQFGYSSVVSLVSFLLGPQHSAEIQTLAAGAICDYAVTDMNRYGMNLWYQISLE